MTAVQIRHEKKAKRDTALEAKHPSDDFALSDCIIIKDFKKGPFNPRYFGDLCVQRVINENSLMVTDPKGELKKVSAVYCKKVNDAWEATQAALIYAKGLPALQANQEEATPPQHSYALHPCLEWTATS